MKNRMIHCIAFCFAATLAAAQQHMKCRPDEVLFEGIDAMLPAEEYEALCNERLIECLIEAVDSRDCARIKALVALGLDVNAHIIDDSLIGAPHRTVLHIAAVRGYVDVVEELLQAPDIKVDTIGEFPFMEDDNLLMDDESLMQMTPLLLALAQGKVISAKETGSPADYEKVVELLVAHQACCRSAIDADYKCEDALLFAIKHGTPKMAKALIGANARVDEKVLHEVLKTHIDDSGEFNEDWFAVIEELMLNGADIDVPIEKENSFRKAIEEGMQDAYEKSRKFAVRINEIIEKVEERNKETSIKTQEDLIEDKFLINDLAKMVATYISN